MADQFAQWRLPAWLRPLTGLAEIAGSILMFAGIWQCVCSVGRFVALHCDGRRHHDSYSAPGPLSCNCHSNNIIYTFIIDFTIEPFLYKYHYHIRILDEAHLFTSLKAIRNLLKIRNQIETGVTVIKAGYPHSNFMFKLVHSTPYPSDPPITTIVPTYRFAYSS